MRRWPEAFLGDIARQRTNCDNVIEHENGSLVRVCRRGCRAGVDASAGDGFRHAARRRRGGDSRAVDRRGVDYITREITIQPGGSTGWHYHDGRVFGVIREGTLTRTLANCQVDGVFPAGSPVTEGSGPDHVHLGRNLEPIPLVMWVVYIEPSGTPLSVEVRDSGCGFA